MVRGMLRGLPALLALGALCACQGGMNSQSAIPGQVAGTQAIPSMKPTAKPTAPSTGILGCPYPSGNVYQASIANASPVSMSAKYITATIAGGGGGGFQAWVSLQDINSATQLDAAGYRQTR